MDRPELAGMRLDLFLSEGLGLFSRSQARGRVQEALVNGKPARLSKRLKLGDVVRVRWSEAPPMDLVPEDIPLEILYEDANVIVVDKPQGMVVHPGSGNASHTLANALVYHCAQVQALFPPGDLRPGIVHRLDKETSGVIIVAKNPSAHEMLAGQFRARSVRKRYLALVRGRPKEEAGVIDQRIARDPRHRKRFTGVASGGRQATTRYRVVQTIDGYSVLQLAPRTGRTHQLRVHLLHIGLPILGDPIYGTRDSRFPDATLMLHARSLTLLLPGESEPRRFVAAVPERFYEVLRELYSSSPRNGL
ncbi:MAG TPA: RluA family pseudouridine synthase [Spirochaetia bacterium]|nr:RluA family pseudouridine synthase [Spirochaetia bacterium]